MKLNLLLLKDRRYDKRLKVIPGWITACIIACLFLSFIPAAFYGYWLATRLHIQMGNTVKDQPNGGLFMTLFLSGFAIIISLGYILGFVFAAIILRYKYRWSWEKVKALMLYSILPSEWTDSKSQ